MTFRNAAGYYGGSRGKTNYGQTLAIYIDGDKTIFKNCLFLSGQDTFYAADVRVYVKNSYIEGTTDFIFGAATAVFENCKIHSYGGTAITAASTKKYVDFGFVFRNCKITAESDVKTLLGRAWRDYAAVAFINSYLGDCIRSKGWSAWNEPIRKERSRYAEYMNNGPGYKPSQRVMWAKILSASEAEKYKTLNILKTTYDETPSVDNWNPKMVLQKVEKHISQ